MRKGWQEFIVTDRLRANLADRLRGQAEIFTFREEPLLASLVSALGFDFEIGNPERDRLSTALGIDPTAYPSNPWHTEVIAIDGSLGIRMWIDEVIEFVPRHADFAEILHPSSLDAQGRLSQIVLSPVRIAERYRERGLELVIVRDWALDSYLSGQTPVNYLVANEHELRKNIARTHIRLMTRRQLAFFGTHDLTDHLLGGHGSGLDARAGLFERIQNTFNRVFSKGQAPDHRSLILSYLIGVLIDDCGQPAWYASVRHDQALEWALELLEASQNRDLPSIPLALPDFSPLIQALRSPSVDSEELRRRWKALASSIETP